MPDIKRNEKTTVKGQRHSTAARIEIDRSPQTDLPILNNIKIDIV